MMQFNEQVTIKLISQLIKDISRVLQNLLKYFNGTAIFTFIILALSILSNILDLNLNHSDSIIPALFNGGSFLQIHLNFQMFLNNYGYILSNYTLPLQHQHLSHYFIVWYLFCLYSW